VGLFILTTALLVYKMGLIGAGVRLILFSWVGMVICLLVGKKIFAGFHFSKVLFESTVIPATTSLVVFFFGTWMMKVCAVDGWVGIVLLAGVAALVLSLGAVGVNWIVFRRNGSGVILAQKVADNRRVQLLMNKLGVRHQ